MREALEVGEVVDDAAAEEGGAVSKGRLVDDDLGAFGLDALHHALDGRLAEVVGVGLHGQAVNAYHTVVLVLGTEIASVEVVVITSFS